MREETTLDIFGPLFIDKIDQKYHKEKKYMSKPFHTLFIFEKNNHFLWPHSFSASHDLYLPSHCCE